MGVLNQFLCTCVACFLCFSLGLIFAWPASTMRLFQSANTTLERPMSVTENALFSSLSSIGALVATPIIGFCLDIFGRKKCALAAGLVTVLSWIIIASSSKVELILLAVFVSGVGGASILIVPVIVSEICQESIRGGMTSFALVFYAIGILASYVMGGFLEYHLMVYICLSLTFTGAVTLFFLRETPLYLMKIGLEKEAQEAFAFYRNASFDSKIVLQEMETLHRAFNPVLDDDDVNSETILPEEEKLKPVSYEEKPQEKLSFFKFVRKSRSTRRAMYATLVINTACVFQGIVVLMVYADFLFEQAVPSMSPTLCSAILAIISIVTGFVSAYLTEICGRRPLLIYSSLASAICCAILGSQLHFHWAPHWLTAVMIFLYSITFNIGAGAIPFVLIAEVFLPEVKSIMSMLVIEWGWFCNFVILFIFSPLVTAIGLGPVFYVFSGVCVFTVVYCLIWLPETKGLSVDVIQDKFMGISSRKTEC